MNSNNLNDPTNSIHIANSINSTNSKNKLNWYAIYTRPRFEKKVDMELKRKGIESYLPIQTVVRQWSDRKKKVDQPLFGGYVFVHTTSNDRIDSLQVDGVVRMIGFGGKPSIIPDDQIESIKRFLTEGFRFEPIDYLVKGDRVKVTYGPLMGVEGKLVEKRNERRFVISIEAIRQSIAVEIDPGLLRKIE